MFTCSIRRQYRKRIKEFLEELTSSKVKCEENDDSLSLEIWDHDVDSRSQSAEVTTESEDSQDILCDSMFTVDTQPQMQDDFDVPTYGKVCYSATLVGGINALMYSWLSRYLVLNAVVRVILEI